MLAQTTTVSSTTSFDSSTKITVISQDDVPHAGTLCPRLESSVTLIRSILSQLESKRIDLEKINKSLTSSFVPPASNNNHAGHLAITTAILEKSLNNQRLVCQAIASLDKISKKLDDISTLSNIPSTLASTIPAIRVLSSSLFQLVPECSQLLCELSVTLGSIVMDSAILTNANCNFGLSNMESNLLLDEAKLMADSEISKQYPNLEITKNKKTSNI